MVTGSEIVREPREALGWMVCTPAPRIWNTTVSAPEWLLASRTAWRRESAPLSLVFRTVYTDSSVRSSSGSRAGRTDCGLAPDARRASAFFLADRPRRDERNCNIA